MPLYEAVKKHNSCSFLYDPKLYIALPKFKVLITYGDELIKVLGCNILVRADLDKTALFFVQQDAKAEKKEISKYILYIFKKSENSITWENLIKLKFNSNKYVFELI